MYRRSIFCAHGFDTTETGSTGHTVEMVHKSSKTDPMKLSFSLFIDNDPPTSLDELGIEAATSALAQSRLALVRRDPGRLVSTISDSVDTAVSIGAHAQAVAEGAKELDSEKVIGILVRALDAVVGIGDELSAVRYLHYDM